jgi:hypothetical protein
MIQLKYETMQDFFKPFYRNFYLKTGGFIPTVPVNQHIYPGDFFQIQDGEIVVLGNIFQSGIIRSENVMLEYDYPLNPASWKLSEGVAERNLRVDTDASSRLEMSFKEKGSFYFSANHPKAVRIQNWGAIQDELIIKMTLTHYSFRELYLATEVAMASDWGLVISGDKNGRLEIVNDKDNFGLTDIFGHTGSRTTQSVNIEYYHQESKKKPLFCKAKKLGVTDDQLSIFQSDLINSRTSRANWAQSFFDFDFDLNELNPPQSLVNSDTSALDMLQSNQLNPSTALQYFRWTDANMDDVEYFFRD